MEHPKSREEIEKRIAELKAKKLASGVVADKKTENPEAETKKKRNKGSRAVRHTKVIANKARKATQKGVKGVENLSGKVEEAAGAAWKDLKDSADMVTPTRQDLREMLTEGVEEFKKSGKSVKEGAKNVAKKAKEGARVGIREVRSSTKEFGDILKEELIPTEEDKQKIREARDRVLETVEDGLNMYGGFTPLGVTPPPIEHTERERKESIWKKIKDRITKIGKNVTITSKDGLSMYGGFTPLGVTPPPIEHTEREKTPISPEMLSHLRAGLGARPEDDATARTREGERSRVTPESTPLPEEREVREEIREMPKAEREKLGFGIHRIGFSVEQKKNEFFAKVFGFFAETNLNQDHVKTKWTRKLAEGFERDADIAHKKAKEDKDGTHKRQVVNAVSLVGNVMRYGRVVWDLSTKSLASPLRYVMMAGMAFTRGSEAAKEVRFDNEEVIEQTRIADAEQAAEEAWKIYERAQAKTNDNSGVNMSAEALKNAYLMEMPEDLKKRLENPGTANGFLQAMFRKEMSLAMGVLNKTLGKIDANEELTAQQKEKEKEKLLRKWEKSLKDYDRVLTQYGTIDELAMGARYAQMLGKGVVAAVTLETIFLSVEKLVESLSDAQIASDIREAVTNKFDTAETPTTDPIFAQIPKGELGSDSNILTNTQDIVAKPDATMVAIDTTAQGDVQEILGNKAGVITTESPQPGSLNEAIQQVNSPDKTTIDLEKFAPKFGASVEAPLGAQTIMIDTSPLEESTSNLENVPHSLETPASFEVSKVGGLEHAYEKLILDHTLPTKLPEGIVVDQEVATRALNEAANLVKLTEGHSVAGISLERFNEAVDFKNGVLNITNPDKFNSILDDLHKHSGKLMDDGVFKNPDSATGYIKKVDWLEKVRADDMRGTATEAGITGHPEATANQIADFSRIPGVPSAEVIKAQAQVLESFEGGLTPEEHLENQRQFVESAEGNNVAEVTQNVANTTETSKMSPDAFLKIENPATYEPYGKAWIDVNTPSGLSAEVLKQVNNIYEQSITSAFPTDTEDVWGAVRNGSASEMLSTKDADLEEGLAPFASFLHKLQNVTGLNPENETPFRIAETNEEFVKRALQKAAELGQLDKVKM
jgi:hypothetical protein